MSSKPVSAAASSAPDELGKDYHHIRIARALEAADMLAWYWDPATNMIIESGNTERFLGLFPGSHARAANDILTLIHPDDRARVKHAMRDAAAAGRGFSEEFRLVRPDGSIVQVLGKGQMLRNAAAGKPAGMSGVLIDLTQCRNVEAALRASEERFQSFMTHSPALSWIVGLDHCFIYLSPPFIRQIYLGTDQPVGKSLFEIYPEEIAEEYARNNLAVATENRVIQTVERAPRMDGTRGIFLVYKFPIRDAAGRLTVGGVAVDITEHERSRAALRDSEERFRVAQELSLDGFAILQAIRGPSGAISDFRCTYANPAAARMLGRTREALHEQCLADIVNDPASHRAALEHCERVLEDEMPHDQEVPVNSTDISGWFRIMTLKLGDGVAVCFSDITERKLAEAAQRQADKHKDEFLATLAHELRNPLAPIRNAVQLLREHGPTDPLLNRARDIIDRQVTHMARLVDDLLDLARITQGKLELRKERVALDAVIERALETSRPLIMAARHELRIRMPGEPVLLDADPDRLAQVLSNLLSNAAKYTQPGGWIELQTELAGSDIVIRVRDCGIGMSKDELGRIFDMFAQLDAGIGHSQGGLGIGLTIVKRLVEMHGGSISAASSGPGCGSEFTVRLPSIYKSAAPTDEADSAGNSQSPRTGRRVLIADDNRDAADTLAMLLELKGYQLWIAYDGLQAVELARTHSPEILLVDIGMPGLNGYEVATQLRQHPETRQAFMVAMTGWGQDSDRQRARDAGFDRHLVKPLDLQALDALLALAEQGNP